ncbi:MAG TPA: hypothetical protein VGH64_00240, partial [Puia sp.]
MKPCLSIFIFFVISLFATSNGISQNIQLGIKGGLSFPNLASSGGSDVSKGYKTISGPDVGLVVEYRMAKNL